MFIVNKKHLWKWILGSVTLVGVASTLSQCNIDSNAEPKSESSLDSKPEEKVTESNQTSILEQKADEGTGVVNWVYNYVESIDVPDYSGFTVNDSNKSEEAESNVGVNPTVDYVLQTIGVDNDFTVTEVQPEEIVSDNGEPEIREALPEYVIEAHGEPEVVEELPEAIVSEKGEPEIQDALPEYVISEKGEPEVQQVLPEGVVTEKGVPEIQAELPEAVVTEKGEPEIQAELPEAVITEKGTPEVQQPLDSAIVNNEGETVIVNTGEPEVQPALPDAVITEKGEPEVQAELPEAVITEKGTPEVQPELPQAVISEKGEPAVQQALPEAVITEKGEPEVQAELPEAVITEKGTPEVQAELPQAVISEKGEPEVQQALPEYKAPEKAPEKVVTEKGTPEVQQERPTYRTQTVAKSTVETIPAPTKEVIDNNLEIGTNKIDNPGKDGRIVRRYEDVLGEDGKVLSSTLKDEQRIEPVTRIMRVGGKAKNGEASEQGMYRLSEHAKDIKLVSFRQDVKLSAEEIKALGQDEITKRGDENLVNSIVYTKDDPHLYHAANAPLSDETIAKFNDGTYINHKNVGLEVLKLVNAERKRLGKHELQWSDGLYKLSTIRAKEMASNGNIGFWTDEGKVLAHVRDSKGTPWHTVSKGTDYANRGMGENLAGRTLSYNVYQLFSEKIIANQLYNQWKNSKGHYANMIADNYTEFGFDYGLSQFWRRNKVEVDYFSQGLHGVQLFAI
jgi:IgA-specific serine endopeptidase